MGTSIIDAVVWLVKTPVLAAVAVIKAWVSLPWWLHYVMIPAYGVAGLFLLLKMIN